MGEKIGKRDGGEGGWTGGGGDSGGGGGDTRETQRVCGGRCRDEREGGESGMRGGGREGVGGVEGEERDRQRQRQGNRAPTKYKLCNRTFAYMY